MSYIFIVIMLFLSGCGETDNEKLSLKQKILTSSAANEVVALQEMNRTKLFEVKLLNITAAQTFSPVTFLADDNYELFSLGKSASKALELEAEGADSSLITEDVANSKVSPSNVYAGASATLNITTTTEKKLSLVAMLISTNDTFVALKDFDLTLLDINDSTELELKAYDAGTEKNSEEALSIQRGGVGFNAERNDGLVRVASGIISRDDGLSSSALKEIHRFDNPVALFSIKRLQ